MRIIYLDITRATAILLVIFLHTWDSFMLRTDFVRSLPGWGIYQLGQISGRLGVPLFLMLTGALMLGRTYPDIGGFIKNKIPRFCGALLVAAVVYALLAHGLLGTDLAERVGRFLRGDPVGAYHLWYMYMLIGLYVSLPYLARLLSSLTSKEIIYLILGAIILVMLPWTLAAAHSRAAYFTSYSFLLQTYTLYAVTGFWLYKYQGLKEIPLLLRAIMFILLLIAAVLIKIDCDYAAGTAPIPCSTLLWYESLLTYAAGVLLFSLLRDVFANRKSMGKFTVLMAQTAYSCYLWHITAIYLILWLMNRYHLNFRLMFVLTFPLALLPGIILYRLLKKSRINWLVC